MVLQGISFEGDLMWIEIAPILRGETRGRVNKEGKSHQKVDVTVKIFTHRERLLELILAEGDGTSEFVRKLFKHPEMVKVRKLAKPKEE